VSLEEQVAQVDLDYSLAIDSDGTSPDSVSAWPMPTGARIYVADDTYEAHRLLSAAECVRLGHYLLACAKAAGS
jgi:hypothetical protein